MFFLDRLLTHRTALVESLSSTSRQFLLPARLSLFDFCLISVCFLSTVHTSRIVRTRAKDRISRIHFCKSNHLRTYLTGPVRRPIKHVLFLTAIVQTFPSEASVRINQETLEWKRYLCFQPYLLSFNLRLFKFLLSFS